ncbi:hypothetical protein B0H14DRAFT_2624398 [Mycena olivaceomarginata]|nr:hypothetical protein B0H14DRAFT_2632267 [Mycena olivaceomarginata]KAJ7792054.1 hypothetical protein B0H14DRAFT_2624398 [Mycena olivaceomarginata]
MSSSMSSDVESAQDEQQYNSEDEHRCQPEWAEYELRRAAYDLKCTESKHPEVKEKKRVKAAEQRDELQLVSSAAKKLARRRWDPAPKRKSDQPLGDSWEEPDLDLTPDVWTPPLLSTRRQM